MARRSTSERRNSRRPLTVRIDGKRPLSERTRTESADSPSTRAASLGVRRSSGLWFMVEVLVLGSGFGAATSRRNHFYEARQRRPPNSGLPPSERLRDPGPPDRA